ncbi:hypothetical protein C472_11499 [Halorubrum tebenquichense DSM 14210]|uniref:Uncharacterized protein n=1 Tax=Halorubrum tebenquichense DSM 14210 TaxID=1227485 RepID=M0DNC7_9EURY|nr:hypothetical protein C472_11499 [Halorubrum tebenquichense DSM 14210]
MVFVSLISVRTIRNFRRATHRVNASSRRRNTVTRPIIGQLLGYGSSMTGPVKHRTIWTCFDGGTSIHVVANSGR